MLVWRLYATVKFNRPIKETDYISPGGYEFTFGDKTISFDFYESCGEPDEERRDIWHYYHRNPLYEEFPELKTLTKEILQNITNIPDWYIYTDSDANDAPLYPEEVLSARIIFPNDDFEAIEIPKEILKQIKNGMNN